MPLPTTASARGLALRTLVAVALVVAIRSDATHTTNVSATNTAATTTMTTARLHGVERDERSIAVGARGGL